MYDTPSEAKRAVTVPANSPSMLRRMSRVPKPCGWRPRRGDRWSRATKRAVSATRYVGGPPTSAGRGAPRCSKATQVFHRIGHQLVQDKSEIDGVPGREVHLRSRDPDALVLLAAIGYELLLDDILQVRIPPGIAGEKIVGFRQGQKPALEGLAELRGSGVERCVCAAIDWTVARVFLTRWFSSSRRRRCWFSACLRR